MRFVRWESEIPGYLRFYNSYYIGCNVADYIFVEGESDVNFISDFLNTNIEINGKNVYLSVPKDRILCNLYLPIDILTNNFYSSSNSIISSEISDLQSKKDRYNSIFEAFGRGDSKYNAFDFVKNTISEFCKYKDSKYRNIDCFGIIDYDFGQHEIDKDINNNISLTEMHDRETTLFRYTLPAFVNTIQDENKRNDVIDFIKNALILSYKQGKCEKYFWKDIYSKDLSTISIETFQNNSLLDIVKKEYNARNKSFDRSLIKKWLNKEGLTELENDDIDEIFSLIGGSNIFEKLPDKLKELINSKNGYNEYISIPPNCKNDKIKDVDSFVYRNKLPEYFCETYHSKTETEINYDTNINERIDEVIDAIENSYEYGIIDLLVWDKYKHLIKHKNFKEERVSNFTDLNSIIDEINSDSSLHSILDGWLRGQLCEASEIDKLFLTINAHELIRNLNRATAFRDDCIKKNQPNSETPSISIKTSDDKFITYYLNACKCVGIRCEIDELFNHKPFNKYIDYLKKKIF